MKIKFKFYRSFLDNGKYLSLVKSTVEKLKPHATLTKTTESYFFEFEGERSLFLKKARGLISFCQSFKIKPIEYGEDHPAFQKAGWFDTLQSHYRYNGTMKHLIQMKRNDTLFNYLRDIREIRQFKCIQNDLGCIDTILSEESSERLVAAFKTEQLFQSKRTISGLGLDQSFLVSMKERVS